MRLLLDTQVLLWWLTDSNRLSPAVRKLIADSTHVVHVSAASVWECRIKESLGKLTLPRDFAQVLEQQAFEMLAVSADHAHALAKLPPHHRDPFDRILIAQAMIEQLGIISSDRIFSKYSVELAAHGGSR